MFAAPEFAPEIFGVSSDKLFAISGTLVTPALGFLFLYLLRLPLTSLPVIGATGDWKPPSWALPVFALTSTAAVVFATVLGLTLELSPKAPRPDEMTGHFGFVRDIVTTDLRAVRSAVVSIDDYDGVSDLRVIVNGYVPFSTSTDCMMTYQCKPSGADISPEATQLLQGQPLDHVSLFRVKQRYQLPIRLDVTNFLVPGTNFVDIISGNTGVGNCQVSVTTAISDGNGTTKNVQMSILDAEGESLDVRVGAKDQETFFSGYRPSGGSFEPTVHPIYRTLEANPSYRLCQRIRMVVQLSADQLSWRTEAAWIQWAQARRKREDCEVRNVSDGVCGR